VDSSFYCHSNVICNRIAITLVNEHLTNHAEGNECLEGEKNTGVELCWLFMVFFFGVWLEFEVYGF
jgi:hypothetical protein